MNIYDTHMVSALLATGPAQPGAGYIMNAQAQIRKIIDDVRETGFSHTLPGNYLWLSRGDELIEEQNWFLKQLSEDELLHYPATEFDPNAVYLTCGVEFEVADPDDDTILQFFNTDL